jgi:3-dehydroquinate synthase
LHGEAVSVGIVMAAFMSERLGWIDQSIFKRTTSLLEKYRLPVQVPSLMTKQLFMNFMAIDKKSENGQVRFILLRGELGGCVFTGDFDQSKLEETLDSYVKAD